MSTARVLRDLTITTFIAASSYLNWKGIQDARAFDHGATKDLINQDFSNNVSVAVGLGIAFAAYEMIETLASTGVWNKLSTKEKFGYCLLLLVAGAGFSYSGVQIILGNTTTTLYGKGLPTVAGTLLSGIANNAASFIASRREETEEPTEETRLTI